MSSTDNPSTILVAGATGFLGNEICRQLIAKNKKVKGLCRPSSDPDKVAKLKESGAEMVEGDLKNKTYDDNSAGNINFNFDCYLHNLL